MGKEQAALSTNNAASQHPFRDVPAWANSYIAYAYHNDLAFGVGDEKFGSTDPVTAAQYFTFVLRALGYSDGQGDFAWEQAVRKAEQLGMKEAVSYTTSSQKLLSGNLTHISYHSLHMPLKDKKMTLYQKLAEEDIVESNPRRSFSNIRHDMKRSLSVEHNEVIGLAHILYDTNRLPSATDFNEDSIIITEELLLDVG